MSLIARQLCAWSAHNGYSVKCASQHGWISIAWSHRVRRLEVDRHDRGARGRRQCLAAVVCGADDRRSRRGAPTPRGACGFGLGSPHMPPAHSAGYPDYTFLCSAT